MTGEVWCGGRGGGDRLWQVFVQHHLAMFSLRASVMALCRHCTITQSHNRTITQPQANQYYKLFIPWTNQKIKSTFVERNMFEFKHITPFDRA